MMGGIHGGLSIAIATFAIAACTKKNPSYCDSTADCDDGLDCLVSSHTCVVPPDAPQGCQLILGSGNYEVCFLTSPSDVVQLQSAFDTSSSEYCATAQPEGWLERGQPNSCFVLGESIFATGLYVSGTRPLVLVAATAITVTGVLDVASRSSGIPKTGPAADDPSCGSPQNVPVASINGGGGGAGGTFLTTGGDGGGGNGDDTTGGLAFDLVSTPPLTRLRGGCPGQDGGEGDSNNTFGGRGAGGGAVYLVAGASITLADNSSINASGAGASKAGRQGGGGGGGSGGMILLDAPAVVGGTGSTMIANGGGGSGGGNDTGGCGCFAGSDPDPVDPLVSALGGNGNAPGGAGFAQGFAAVNGNNGGSNLGGGGGGGGGGYIQTTTALTSITASPTPVVLP